MTNEPWVLVAGGFHSNGGMEKANLALAEYLVDQGHVVHLVSHFVADQIRNNPLAKTHIVPRPLHAAILAEPMIQLLGRATIKAVKRQSPRARVLTNGGNCEWNDINWAHYVHSASLLSDADAPKWFRTKNRIAQTLGIMSEKRAFRSAKLVLANSDTTRRDLIEKAGIEPPKIHTVYLGSELGWAPPTATELQAAKTNLGLIGIAPVVVFVGALGLDNRKGFDTLFTAWQHLCKDPSWDAKLIVAGSGRGLPRWQAQSFAAGLDQKIRFLGFTQHVADLLASADLLVSPVRYEPYGLNAQEAICRGVPVMVSASAGIAERFPPELCGMLLTNPEDPSALVNRLLMWRANMDLWRSRFQELGTLLRSNTWRDMARQIVSLAGDSSRHTCRSASSSISSV